MAGYIMRSPRGRRATRRAYEHLGLQSNAGIANTPISLPGLTPDLFMPPTDEK